MPARNPQDCDLLLADAINAGDVEAAVALYEPDAGFLAEPGKAVTGTEAVREVMSGFMSLKPTITLEVDKVVPSGGDLALTCSKWSLSGTDADGNPVNISGRGTEVVRRQPDGTWLFVIDNPFGTD